MSEKQDESALDDIFERQFERDPLVDKERFRNRRMMAWVALVSMIVVTVSVAIFVDSDKIVVLGLILSTFLYTMAAIILTYMGSTSWVANIYNKNAMQIEKDERGGGKG